MNRIAQQAFGAAIVICVVFATAWPAQSQQARKNSALEGEDMKYFREMAQADLAEIEAGKMAQSKAQNSEVKKYGQHMVEDHGKKAADARSLAKSKGVQMPGAPAKKHQDAARKLAEASNAAFDRMFMQQMVKDHEDALKLARTAAKNAKDKDLKAAASKSVPIIEKHLEMAKSIRASLK